MVLDTSKTGLMPIVSERRRARDGGYSTGDALELQFQNCIQPAPLAVKPFSALLNPFRKGCSIFCNHPTSDSDLKNMIKKTKMRKDEEKEDIGVDRKALAERVGEVLEEMLCRYKRLPGSGEETSSPDDSVTPQSRPVLVLDLMRAASQETLSTNMGGRGTGGVQSSYMSPAVSPVSMCSKTIVNKLPATPMTEIGKQDTECDTATDGGLDDDAEVQKRRGKIKKRKKKGGTANNMDDKSSKEVIGLVEPGETQVSAWREGDDSSWRGSSNATPQPMSLEPPDATLPLHLTSDIFDDPTLRHLRRSLTLQQAEGEFRRIWRNVLLEALAASDKPPEVQPSVAKGDLIFEPSVPELWKAYPKEFKYSSARFDIPISKAMLNGMSSLDYLKNHVVVAKEYRLLYNHVFTLFRENPDDGPPWFMLGKNILSGLAQVMGRPFTKEEGEELLFLINWRPDDHIDLRTWIGVAALAERVFGLRFSTSADPDMGERQVIEQVDFEALSERKKRLKLNKNLKALLEAVQNVERKRKCKTYPIHDDGS